MPRKAYLPAMERIFDMDDRARLPWRFYGATHSVLARL
ncbi:isopropylmalate isomerase [Roseivivax sp. CAU 1761]